MKKASIYALIIGSLSIVVFLSYAFLIAPWPGDTIRERTITSGSAGDYSIGSTKEELIRENFDFAFSPFPKPAECPKNWIYIKDMTPTQRTCLLNAEEWEAGFAGPDICDEKEDFHVVLHFSHERLDRIKIRCTLAI